MVKHGGRCPNCQNRTTPGIGIRAGLWLCVPCRQLFDNQGNPQDDKKDPGLRPPASPHSPAAIRSLIWKSV